MCRDNLEKLADKFEGSVQFAFVNALLADNERLRLAYQAYETPIAFLVDPETNAAYIFDQVVPYATNTTNWIKEKQYLDGNPLKLSPIPRTLSKTMLYVEYARRDARFFWRRLASAYGINDFLLGRNISYFAIPADFNEWTSVKVYDQVDRCLVVMAFLTLLFVYFILCIFSVICIYGIAKVLGVKFNQVNNKNLG